MLVELGSRNCKQGDCGLRRDCFCDHGIADPIGLMREIRDRVVDVHSASGLKHMLDAHRHTSLFIGDTARIDAFCTQENASEHQVGNIFNVWAGSWRWVRWKPAVNCEVHVRYLPWGFKLVNEAP